MMRQRPRDQAEVQKGIERSRSRWSTQERKFVITIRLYIGEKKVLRGWTDLGSPIVN